MAAVSITGSAKRREPVPIAGYATQTIQLNDQEFTLLVLNPETSCPWYLASDVARLLSLDRTESMCRRVARKDVMTLDVAYLDLPLPNKKRRASYDARTFVTLSGIISILTTTRARKDRRSPLQEAFTDWARRQLQAVVAVRAATPDALPDDTTLGAQPTLGHRNGNSQPLREATVAPSPLATASVSGLRPLPLSELDMLVRYADLAAESTRQLVECRQLASRGEEVAKLGFSGAEKLFRDSFAQQEALEKRVLLLERRLLALESPTAPTAFHSSTPPERKVLHVPRDRRAEFATRLEQLAAGQHDTEPTALRNLLTRHVAYWLGATRTRTDDEAFRETYRKIYKVFHERTGIDFVQLASLTHGDSTELRLRPLDVAEAQGRLYALYKVALEVCPRSDIPFRSVPGVPACAS